NGATWTAPLDMPMPNKLATRQSDPWLIWKDDSLFYAYLEFTIDGTISRITMAKSTDYGETWTTTSASRGIGFADKETMTVSNDGTVYVAYDDIDEFSTIVRLTRSDDDGDTFKEISVIADSVNDPEDHVGPYVTTDSSNSVYVAWFRLTDDPWGDIYLTSSSDRGVTLSNAKDINTDSENCSYIDLGGRPSKLSLPVIRFDRNDRLYVIWSEKYEPNGSWDVYLKYSDDRGLNWSSRYQVNPITEGNQWQPDMDIDSKGRVHVVWYDQQGASFRPCYRMITFPEVMENDPVFSDPIAVASVNTSNFFTRPGDYFTIRVDSNDIPHVVWTDGRNVEMDIYYSHGILGQPPLTITTSTPEQPPSTTTTSTPEQPPSTTTTSSSLETTSSTTTTTELAGTREILTVVIAFSTLMVFSRRRKKK
ncbi:MAG: sialidase family protein, partial [Candidatus Odinarchaeota archaeon]